MVSSEAPVNLYKIYALTLCNNRGGDEYAGVEERTHDGFCDASPKSLFRFSGFFNERIECGLQEISPLLFNNIIGEFLQHLSGFLVVRCCRVRH